ncbi:MAG: LuxR C-terminal-related transcriptional regulator [Leifsonia sp.]
MLKADRDRVVPLLVELEELLPRLWETSKTPLVLILDDVDLLTDASLLGDLISLTARHGNLKLITCARGPHVSESLAPHAQILQTQDLQFTPQEAVELGTICEPEVASERVTLFHHQVGGWAAPLHLLVQAESAGKATEGVAEKWFRNFVLRSPRAHHILDSLLLFSLAERLDQRLVDDLAATDPSISRFAVDLIERPGLLEQHHRKDGIVYEFPPVVRQSLRERIGRDRQKTQDFHRRLARWYRAQPHGFDAAFAFWHAVAGEDYEAAHQTWAEHSPRMIMTDPALYRRALELLPTDVFARFPGMQVVLAAAQAATDDTHPLGRDTTFRALSAAAGRVLAVNGMSLPLPDLLSVGTGHLLGMRRRGNLTRANVFAVELADRVSTLAGKGESVPVSMLAWFTIQRGLTCAVAGKHQEALHHFEEAWSLEPGGQRTFISVNAAANLAMIHALHGDRRSATAWLERHDRTAAIPGWFERIASAGADIAKGFIALDAGDFSDYDAATAHLRTASEQHDLWVFVASLHAQHGLRTRTPSRALAALNHALNSRPDEHASELSKHGLLLRAQADLLIAMNQGHQVQDILTRSDNALLDVPRARLLCLSDRPQNAAHLISTAQNGAAHSERDQLEMLVVSISAANRLGNHHRAIELVDLARELGARIGVAEPLAGLPALDRTALDLHIEEPPTYPDRVHLIRLTGRERELLNTLLLTRSRQETAANLFISMNTLKTQLAGLYRKLDARTQTEAIANARARGLLPTDPTSADGGQTGKAETSPSAREIDWGRA